MKDEIKKILEILKEDLYIPQEDNREYKLLDKGDDKLLLDYITNLQEENERLKRLVGKDYTELNIVEMKATIYKSRIDKAIEILKDTNLEMPSTLLIETIDYALKILEVNENK